MGIKATIIANPVTAAHQTSALKTGVNASGLVVALLEQIAEVIYLLKEVIKTLPSVSLTANGTITTASPNITMAATIPASIVPGMTVLDAANSKQLGVVSSGAGTTTLVLQANSAFAGSGSSDVLTISDPNLATYQSLVTSLS